MSHGIDVGRFEGGPYLTKVQAKEMFESVSPASITPEISDGAITVSPGLGTDNTVQIVPSEATTVTLGAGGVMGVPSRVSLVIIQPSSAGFPVTLAGTIKWSGGAAPIISSSAGTTTIINFMTLDGGQTYFGGV